MFNPFTKQYNNGLEDGYDKGQEEGQN